MAVFRPASIGKTGILSIKHGGNEVSRYRPDLGDAEIDISSVEKTTTTGKFTTINGGKLESCVIAFEPKQSGSGTPSPQNVRPITGHTQVEVDNVGKNLLKTNLSTIKSSNTAGTWSGNTYVSNNGVKIEVLIDNNNYFVGLRLNGTASARTFFYFNPNALSILQVGNYIINGGATSASIRAWKYDGSTIASSQGQDVPFTLNEQGRTSGAVDLDITANVSFNNVILKPMIRLATDTDATFAPYQGQDIIVALGDTYGQGTHDVVSGELTVYEVFAKVSDLTWTTQSSDYAKFVAVIDNLKFGNELKTVKSDIYKSYSNADKPKFVNGCYAGFGGNVTTIKVYDEDYPNTSDLESWKIARANNVFCYDLATPITIQLTPQQINTLIGENHLDVPLEGQSLDSAVYRELFAWDDVTDVVDTRLPISAIGTDESGRTTASKAYAVGEHFYKDGKFCTAIASISSGATLTLNTNYVEGTIADYFTGESSNVTVDASATYITLNSQRSSVERCGNHVSVQIRFVVANMPTISGGTTLFVLPWKMTGQLKAGVLLNQATGYMENYGLYVNANSKNIRTTVTIPNGEYYFSIDYITADAL